jgi:membrane associated rhomboid family serine protease
VSQPPYPGSDPSLPPDWEPGSPDNLDVRHCYRHPERETGVSCSNCGRPICYECMIQAPVGIRCPECVREQQAGGSRAKVYTRGQIRQRWGAGGRSAPVTRILIGINVAVFVVQFLSVAAGDLIALGGVTTAIAEGEYWRLLTAMFLHAGILHLAFNMLALYVGGSVLEMIAGRGKYLIIYFVAGVAGNVAAYALSPSSVSTVGASGAIFGIFGALFLYSLHNRGTAAGQALRSMGTVILINLLISFVFSGISWQAHVGGLLGGMAAMEALSWFGRRDLGAPLGARDVALVVVLAVVLVVIVMWRTAALGG